MDDYKIEQNEIIEDMILFLAEQSYDDTGVLLLRLASSVVEKRKGQEHFPELIFQPELQDDQSAAIHYAARMIAKHGNQDVGHKVSFRKVAALIHYIADMME